MRELPKAHLHLHLVGSMRPETLSELGHEAGILVDLPDGFDGFRDFYETYALANRTIRSADHLDRLIFEVLQDASSDGAVWVEPTLYLDSFTEVIGPGELVLEIVTDSLRKARSEIGIGARLIVSADRDLGPADAVRQARLAVRGDPDVVGAFGLVNDEMAHPVEDFVEALAITSGAGLALTPHSGEFGGPDHVAAALGLGAARIQHGIAAAADTRVMRRLAESRVCLDVCPTSNVAVGAVKSLEEHPLPVLVENGVEVSINADDSLLFGCSLLSEYELARDAFGLSDRRIAAIAEASILHSTADGSLKAAAAAAVGKWFAPIG
ncbi:MAG: adenosine deaminase [bacterium]|nr:adenosine deaminase [bacterium]